MCKPDETIKCRYCGFSGPDLVIASCKCTYHTTCFAVSAPFLQRVGHYNENSAGQSLCEFCDCADNGGVYLIPLDIDTILTTSSLDESNRKDTDKEQSILSQVASILSFSSTLDQSNSVSEEVDLRNGRWTNEETQFVDELIKLFECGSLPLPTGLTLNDFLRNILLCKSTRLRKKMKNGNFCTKTYDLNPSILGTLSPLHYAKVCNDFLVSVESDRERCMLRFAMRALWGSHFLDFCAQQGLTFLDANDWLSALEKIEQRCVASREMYKQKLRRKRLSLVVHSTSTHAVDDGISKTSTETSDDSHHTPSDMISSSSTQSIICLDPPKVKRARDERPIVELSDFCGKFADWSPFLERVGDYIKSENLPFQYIYVWIAESTSSNGTSTNETTRAKKSTKTNVQLRHVGHAIRSDIDSIMTLYHMNEFGKYSSSFVFPSGVGLPGRVFEAGSPVFDGSLQAANRFNFPRAIGARTHGVEVGLGIPIHCSYGCVILALYSVDKLKQDINLTQRLCKDLELYQPKPSWTVLVDALPFAKKGRIAALTSSDEGAFDIYDQHDPEEEEMVTLIGNHLSPEAYSKIPSHLVPSANALRFLLLKNPMQRSLKDNNLIDLLKKSYQSYLSAGTKTEFERLLLLLSDWVYLRTEEAEEIPLLPLHQPISNSNNISRTPLSRFSKVVYDSDQLEERLTQISEDEVFSCEGIQSMVDDDDIISSEILRLVDLE